MRIPQADEVADRRQQNSSSCSAVEMRLYATQQNMNKPVEEHRRCWRLEYADGAQFHMDVTPGLPNVPSSYAPCSSRAGSTRSFADTAIAITDIDHPRYRVLSADWPRSNPRGYLKWFLSRMAGHLRTAQAGADPQGRARRHRADSRLRSQHAAAVRHHDPEASPRHHVRRAIRRTSDLDHPDHARGACLQRRGKDHRMRCSRS